MIRELVLSNRQINIFLDKRSTKQTFNISSVIDFLAIKCCFPSFTPTPYRTLTLLLYFIPQSNTTFFESDGRLIDEVDIVGLFKSARKGFGLLLAGISTSFYVMVLNAVVIYPAAGSVSKRLNARSELFAKFLRSMPTYLRELSGDLKKIMIHLTSFA